MLRYWNKTLENISKDQHKEGINFDGIIQYLEYNNNQFKIKNHFKTFFFSMRFIRN